jgi:hypothetical protein
VTARKPAAIDKNHRAFVVGMLQALAAQIADGRIEPEHAAAALGEALASSGFPQHTSDWGERKNVSVEETISRSRSKKRLQPKRKSV